MATTTPDSASSTKRKKRPGKKRSGRRGGGTKTKQVSSRRLSEQADAAKGGNKTIGLIVGAGIVVVAVIGVAIAIISGGDGDKPIANTSPTPNPSNPTDPVKPPSPGPTPQPTRPPNTNSGEVPISKFHPKKPDKPPTKEKLDEMCEETAVEYLSRASDMVYEKEQYEEAVKLLESFPDWLRGGEYYKQIRAKMRRYKQFSGLRNMLKRALDKGATSKELRKAVARIESGKLPDLMLELDCVDRFKDRALKLMGESAYDEIALNAVNIDELEDLRSDPLFDD